MQKVLSAAQIRAADQYTIANEPISSIDLMERASEAFVTEFKKLVPDKVSVLVLCGPGNNGGDGFAIARLLKHDGYPVRAVLIEISEGLSTDCEINMKRASQLMTIEKVKEAAGLELDAELIVDAIFGSGLNRPVEGIASEIIDKVNDSTLPVVAVDIPSGLFADEVNLQGMVMRADYTITFQLPKLSFLFPESGRFAGEWIAVDIGLSREFIEKQDSDFRLIDKEIVAGYLPHRPKFAHKADFGRVQLVAGSKGKMGAAVLCGEACLRSGAGLLTIHVPGVGLEVAQNVLREAMTTVDDCSDYVSKVPKMDKEHTVCVGPGLGTKKETVDALKKLLQRTNKPMVIDADGLNAIAKIPGLLKHVPKGSVLTPHVGEFERMFGKCEDGLARINKMREVAVTFGLVLVLKGAHTAIVDSSGKVCFNTTGNAGMATAGSGDVLAGVITGLLAQGLDGKEAAIAGVFLHGMAGDFSAKKVGKMSLMASDLLNELYQAFNNVSITSLFQKNTNFN